MLESEAREKLCPLSMSVTGVHVRPCMGAECMAWDPQTVPVYEEAIKDGKSWKKYTGRAPKDPPEGFCGMIPPESQCGYPG